jgi:ketosteroid isomerase-like protein
VSAIEALQEKLLRRASGAGVAIEQTQLTFDPQQLRLAPTPRTGASYDNRFISVVTIGNRKIVQWRDYMDSLTAMTAQS